MIIVFFLRVIIGKKNIVETRKEVLRQFFEKDVMPCGTNSKW